MPDPSNYDNENDWMEACMSTAMDEGREHDQAIAMCMQMWRDRDKKAAPPLIDRAWSVLTVKAVDAEQRTIEGIATTPTVDRIGDIVEPLGGTFKLPLPLLWQHKHDQPVGHVIVAKAAKDGITIKARFAKIEEPGELKNLVDKAWQAVKAGLVRGLSIGFSPVWDAVEPLENGGVKFGKWSWHELSLVTIPANADATISLVKTIDRNLQAADGQTGRSGSRESGAAGAGETGSLPGSRDSTLSSPKKALGKSNLKPKGSQMTISEQIRAFQEERAAKAARRMALMEESATKGETLDDEQGEEYETLDREIKAIDRHLKRLEGLEVEMQARAQPVQAKTIEDGAAARSPMIRVRDPDMPKGVRFARVARCLGLAQGNRAEALRISKQVYASDQPTIATLNAAMHYGEVSDLATKADNTPVPAGTTLDPGWAGNLVAASAGESGVVGDFLDFLRPMTIVGKFGTGGIPSLRRVPFRTGLVTQTEGGTGYWVGEAAAKPVTKVDFNRRTLTPLKVANIAVVTDELLRDSSPSADVLLRDSLAGALAQRMDSDFIDPAITAQAGVRPASITNGATAVTAQGGGTYGSADQIRLDVRTLFGNFITANLLPNVWIMRSTTALALSLQYNPLGQPEFPGIGPLGGTFMGLPVITSQYVPATGSPSGDYVVLLDSGSIWFADEGGIRIDMSREASIEMDSAPDGSAGSGSPNAPTALLTTYLVSLWQQNCVGFLAERTVNWAVARTAGVQLLEGANWGEGTEP